ncbi:hypothetical protein HOV00_gp29 [Microbacterium phage Schubert]|uniref:Uncharacterized protein n=1 Tax=Microbacterium phage Schubert TaxID=2500787 RepID=A0A3Q9RAT1_9CAUD|nr:hypothetical protein HOV00_gp29 [Microbacterium phage Schubert]AZV01736.1 hypothetical protein SEA_SCHUBERT_29 [Microbacterium phage Schubert]
MNANTLAERYGVRETNGLENGHEYHSTVDYESITLAELKARGGHISRVRILTGVWPGLGRMADISYIHGTVQGRPVAIRVDVENGIPLRNLKGEFIEWAKREGVYAKGIGLLDEGNWSILY